MLGLRSDADITGRAYAHVAGDMGRVAATMLTPSERYVSNVYP